MGSGRLKRGVLELLSLDLQGVRGTTFAAER